MSVIRSQFPGDTELNKMKYRCSVALFLVLTVHWTSVKSLETVEELLCQDMEPGSRIPHPEFCNVYIICTDSAAMQISCEQRILYNPVADVCDAEYRICLGGLLRDQDGSVLKYEEDELDADIATEIETSEPTEASTESTTSSTTSVEPITTEMPQNQSTQEPSRLIGCPKNDSDKLLLISHATKCSIYFICYHGKPVPMECSMGLYWSEKNYKCVPKELSECHARSNNPYPKCPHSGIDFLPHDENCQLFWFCRDGFRMLQQCDAFYQWDIYERKCKRTGQSVCYNDLRKAMAT